ncbi:hypothetical protein L1987_27780 [Smallanthus sonchifolius]|uniref:Uncharacterized protein n=1 Tax=Smallanthus sonchifolius TaxID=185202 RepID=A0ACB9IB01_9ASTR|nr:hypothetical protein L1987_27780 [Smallanthus sonchifolius]
MTIIAKAMDPQIAILVLKKWIDVAAIGSALNLILGLLGVRMDDAPLALTGRSESVRSVLRCSERVSSKLSACECADDMTK